MSVTPTTQAAETLSRRQALGGLLRLAWLAPLSLGLWQVGRFLGYRPADSVPQRVAVGRPGDLETLPLYLEAVRAWLVRDEGGYYALDAHCTHLGCVVGLASTGESRYECGCHGSRFDRVGQVTRGPAKDPLRHLWLELDEEGDLVIDRAREAEPTFRLALTAAVPDFQRRRVS